MSGSAVGNYAAYWYGVYGLGWPLGSGVAGAPDDSVIEGDSSTMAAAGAILWSPAG